MRVVVFRVRVCICFLQYKMSTRKRERTPSKYRKSSPTRKSHHHRHESPSSKHREVAAEKVKSKPENSQSKRHREKSPSKKRTAERDDKLRRSPLLSPVRKKPVPVNELDVISLSKTDLESKSGHMTFITSNDLVVLGNCSTISPKLSCMKPIWAKLYIIFSQFRSNRYSYFC